jgi:aldose 1-epimerase
MPSIKQDSFGKLSDGREATLYTLRNVDGNELKVTNYGARVISMRFRNKDFQNKFIFKSYPDVSGYENDNITGVVFVNEDISGFDKIFWNVEKIIEGLKLSAEVDGKSVEIIYSLSNDDEMSIKYKATGVEDVSTQLIFSAETLPDSDISVYNEENTKGKIEGDNTYSIIDKPAIVEMEVGMFGYDPGCPIDWIDAGLKNAADIVSEGAAISMNVFATQEKLHVTSVEGGFAVRTSGTKKSDDGVITGQTVYFIKNKD